TKSAHFVNLIWCDLLWLGWRLSHARSCRSQASRGQPSLRFACSIGSRCELCTDPCTLFIHPGDRAVGVLPAADEGARCQQLELAAFGLHANVTVLWVGDQILQLGKASASDARCFQFGHIVFT